MMVSRTAHFLFSILLLSGCTAPLYKPIGLGLPRPLPNKTVRAALQEGIRNAGWTFIDRTRMDGQWVTRARITHHNQMAEVGISQTGRVIHIRYLDSSHLSYEEKESGARILPSYNSAVEHLEEEIALALAARI